MRRLSVRQAMNCENATGHVCKCRCGGALHGANRMPSGDDALTWLDSLDQDDPHHRPLTDREIKKLLAEIEENSHSINELLPF